MLSHGGTFTSADSLGIQKLSDSKLVKEDHYLMQRTPPAPVTPSCIISPDLIAPRAGDLEGEGGGVKVGGLYHGSFRAVMNTDFLKKEGVTHIVNTAKGLEIFGQKYTDAVKYAKKELKIEFLELNWEDIVSYVIKEDDLVRCARFIHRAKTSGGSVLVHCIQGKSRSTTAIVAYLMATGEGKGYEESLRFVRERRRMANPNPTFSKKLQDFARSNALKRLRKELGTQVGKAWSTFVTVILTLDPPLKIPSLILPREPGHGGLGALFHGGFKAVMNVDFLKKEGITHIVSTAKGLDTQFGPRYASAVEHAKKELKIEFLELNWEDIVSYEIKEDDLVRCAHFIHRARASGDSVLVYCAQGKSRSSTAVIAYLMATGKERTFEESFKIVQERRRMADPNPAFCEQLRGFACSPTLKQLQEELISLKM